jgi:lambda family phage portal protein
MKFFQEIKKYFSKKVGKRKFEAARIDRSTFEWATSPIRTNDDIRASLEILTSRSKDLAKNSSLYKHFITLSKHNVVGPNGFKLQAKSYNEIGGKFVQDKVANTIIEEAWLDWCKKYRGYCTMDGKQGFKDFCDSVYGSILIDGECFVRMYRGKMNPYKFSLQIIDASLVDVNLNVALMPGADTYIEMGVEMNIFGRPVAYHILNNTFAPNSQYVLGKYTVIPANEILHIFVQEFPNQVRGYPRASAAILDLNYIDALKEATLVSARMAACTVGVYERGVGVGGQLDFDEETPDSKPLLDMAPGQVSVAPRGWTYKQLSPSHPNQNIENFASLVQRDISSGLGCSYSALTGDLSGANYSSIRYGGLMERDAWRADQEFLIENFLKPVFYAWLEQFLISGKTFLPISKFDKFSNITFIARRWVWVDPLKDQKASELAIDMNLVSPQEVIRETGHDPEELLEEIADWQILLDKYGLKKVDTKQKVDDTSLNEEDED